MKTPFYKHPDTKKWALYSLLFVCLGFSISMNPEHFNNIARHSKNLGVFELAQEAAAGNSKVIKVSNTQGTKMYQATLRPIDAVDGLACAELVELDNNGNASGATIKRCGGALVYSDPTASLQTALMGILENLETSTGASADSPAPAVEKIDLQQYADRCAKLEGSRVLDCHKRNILEISQKVDNNETDAQYVTKYFDDHLKSYFTRAFNAAHYRLENNVLTGAISVKANDSAQENFEDAKSLYNELWEKLASINGKDVRRTLARQLAEGTRRQARENQKILQAGIQMYQQGKTQSKSDNPAIAQMGMQMMAAGSRLATQGHQFLSSHLPFIQEMRLEAEGFATDIAKGNAETEEMYNNLFQTEFYDRTANFLAPLDLVNSNRLLSATYDVDQRVGIYTKIATAPLQGGSSLDTGITNPSVALPGNINMSDFLTARTQDMIRGNTLPGTSIPNVGNTRPLDSNPAATGNFGGRVPSPLEQQGGLQQNRVANPVFGRGQ